VTAHKQEIRDFNNVVTVAIIWLKVVSPGTTNASARVKLNAYIEKYVAKRPHSVYIHADVNAISATIIFNTNTYKEIDITKEVEKL
jgi:hypothetical protein